MIYAMKDVSFLVKIAFLEDQLLVKVAILAINMIPHLMPVLLILHVTLILLVKDAQENFILNLENVKHVLPYRIA